MSQQSAAHPARIPGIEPRRMLDRYEILAEIARGGMGTVYLARLGGAGGFERLFAVKLMHEHLAEEPQFVTMLLDEARTAAHIHHPNAVGIIDARESPVGYYLVMNYVDGFSFSSILDRYDLDPRTRMRLATRLIADAAQGLHAAHTAKSPKGERLSIVHRDVSPQNILVGVDGVGRIVDFGIALAASRITSSRPGMLKGKPSYMAPEQARGELCDARTDVFALGIVLWESLTRAPLFQADLELATLVKVMECVVEPPTKHVPDLHPALTEVTMKALARDPADRFASAREMGVAIERAAEAAGLLADAHEVEETIATLFAEEIRLRQESVTRRLSGSTGPERPLDRAGLATVPRLIPRAAHSSAEPESSGGADSRATRGSRPSRSGVRESRSEVDGAQRDGDDGGSDDRERDGDERDGVRSGEAWHESHPVDAPIAHAATQSAIPAPMGPAPRRSAWLAGAVLIAVGAVLGTIAALMGGGGASPEPAPVAAPAPDLTAPQAAPEAAIEPSVAPAEPPPGVDPPAVDPVAPAVVAPAAVAPAAVAPAAVAPAAVAPAAVDPAPAAGTAPRRRRGATPDGTSTRPSGPQVEVNPYLTH